MPLISVIIPTFNRCRSLEKAVTAVLNQTFQDFEIVIIDDGSTDETPAYCMSIDNPRILCHRIAENRGGGNARNEGILRSRGQYLAFCDDDDVWRADKLERLLAFMKKRALDCAYSGARVCGSDGRQKKYVFHTPHFSSLNKSIMFDNFVASTSMVMLTRDCINRAGMFDPSLPALQDYDLYIRIIKADCRILGLNEPLVDYFILNEKRSVTCNPGLFLKAAAILTGKYRLEPYAHLLKRRMYLIFLTRMLKSRAFCAGALRLAFNRIFRQDQPANA